MVEKTCWIVIRICLCYFLFCINIDNLIPSFLSAPTKFIRQASLLHPIFKRRFCKTAGLCPFEKPTPEKRNLFFLPLPVSHLDVFIFPRDRAPRRQTKFFFNSCRILKIKDKGTPHLGGRTKFFFQLLQNLERQRQSQRQGDTEPRRQKKFFFRILCLRHPYSILCLMRPNTWEIESFPPQIQVYLAGRKI